MAVGVGNTGEYVSGVSPHKFKIELRTTNISCCTICCPVASVPRPAPVDDGDPIAALDGVGDIEPELPELEVGDEAGAFLYASVSISWISSKTGPSKRRRTWTMVFR